MVIGLLQLFSLRVHDWHNDGVFIKGHVQQKVRKIGQVKNQLFQYICNKLNIEGHQAKKISGEESSTISNHIRCSKNTFTVVNIVFCTKSQIL